MLDHQENLDLREHQDQGESVEHQVSVDPRD